MRIKWKNLILAILGLLLVIYVKHVIHSNSMWDTTKYGNLAQWLSAIATSSAVIVALFGQEIFRFIRKPTLNVGINLSPPDCHKTRLTYQPSSNIIMQAECYYMRLWVENVGKTRAEKVQVFASKLLRRNVDGNFRIVENFLPMNLRWAHAQPKFGPEIFADGISPGMGKHCDLGHIVEPSHQRAIYETISVPAGEVILTLDLEVAPNTLSHQIPKGEYRLSLRIAGSNFRPVTKIIYINFKGTWYSDEARMFSDGLGISSPR